MEIDERDVMNMLRHAFLMGMNTNPETWEESERDEYLQEIVDECKREGGASYGKYHGSHCPPDCKGDLDDND